MGRNQQVACIFMIMGLTWVSRFQPVVAVAASTEPLSTTLSIKNESPPLFQKLEDAVELKQVHRSRRNQDASSSLSGCATEEQFTQECVSQLLLDPNQDNLVSHEEFALFVERIPCFFAHPEEELASICTGDNVADASFSKKDEEGAAAPGDTGQDSDDSSVSSSSSFAKLPLRLQLTFVRNVCLHIDDGDEDDMDCVSNLLRHGHGAEKFGFLLNRNNVASDLQAMCMETYNGVLSRGILSSCGRSETVEVRISYMIRTNGIDSSSFLSGADPTNGLRQGLIDGTMLTVRETLLEENLEGNGGQRRLYKIEQEDRDEQHEIQLSLDQAKKEAVENATFSKPYLQPYRGSKKQTGTLSPLRGKRRQQEQQQLHHGGLLESQPTPHENTTKDEKHQGRAFASTVMTHSHRNHKTLKHRTRRRTQSRGRDLAVTYKEGQDSVVITTALDDLCLYPPPDSSDTKCLMVRSTITLLLQHPPSSSTSSQEEEDEVEEEIEESQEAIALRKLIIQGLRTKGIPLSKLAASEGYFV